MNHNLTLNFDVILYIVERRNERFLIDNSWGPEQLEHRQALSGCSNYRVRQLALQLALQLDLRVYDVIRGFRVDLDVQVDKVSQSADLARVVEYYFVCRFVFQHSDKRRLLAGVLLDLEHVVNCFVFWVVVQLRCNDVCWEFAFESPNAVCFSEIVLRAISWCLAGFWVECLFDNGGPCISKHENSVI